ncbi:DUF4885 domain-containing protein [Bacillus sonorensis]|uniref:DUF4885 domain-containing protein n=1 Tax=Bacillus sonorensis TaxID=119858 RepID=UPI001F21225C|nr:DUF4885 domain-containing protein [Bacillus sonorensis]MCF7619999.1 DUF4885 domain-containing protein [Bacillus sonorensis]MCY8034561.1 DUF4885 domain-containing protein [Bacillus sonorensis]MCY8086562.1 DUF4885 domain-containing protein [Bacillus sonorensis]MCY8404459.1 DUF4885 domain-containing protein [Bacillus sonorensis]MCY8563168.1 DUF4885 domain-containing protein [Bacillus sonorensis]
MNIRDKVKLALYTEKLMDAVSHKQPAKTNRSETQAAAKKDTLTISKQAEQAQKNGPSLKSQMNGVQFEIYHLYVNRQRLNSRIEKALRENGITLAENESIQIHVDGKNHITVEGTFDDQKRAQIEKALNGVEQLGARLLSHSDYVGEQNGKPIDKVAYEKWHVNEFLKTMAGLTLADVSLNEAGDIIGGNEKLEQVIQAAADPKSDLEKSFGNMLVKLKNVLKKGPDTIADRSASFGYSGGTLIDLNVSKGFSTGQIDEWLDDPFLRNAIQNV